jgi:hybrid polyketide synthase / nonribosomal peptide synthetase ACE1
MSKYFHFFDKDQGMVLTLCSPFRLNVSRSISHTPLFQSFVNYRQGLLKTTQWGKGGDDDDIALHSVEIGISKMAYDVTLEILDYADGECVQTLVVRKDLYGLAEVQYLAKSYERLMEAFIAEPNLSLDRPDLFAPTEIQEVLRFSRGQYCT